MYDRLRIGKGNRQVVGLFVLLFFCFSLFYSLLFAQQASAVQTVPYKVNFQGYLRSSTGEALADGQYNVTFRLYDASTGGVLVWTEVRQETSRVTLADGYFSVQLGDVAALSPSLFQSQTLHLEVELPTPATATCSTNGCASYTEGPMTPRQPLASSPYAFNADQLDGYDASEFTLGAGDNLFTGMNTFKTDNSAAFAIQSSNGDSLLAANTATMQVTIGAATDGVRLSMNGIELLGSARAARTVTLSPEYSGATFTGDGTNNNGNLSSDFCADGSNLAVNLTACAAPFGSMHSYYQWTTAEVTAQDYDIYVRFRMPSDYSTGSMSDFTIKSFTASTNESLVMSIYDNTGTEISTTGTVGNIESETGSWQTYAALNNANANGVVANEYITFKLSLVATNNGTVRVGDISFDYRSEF